MWMRQCANASVAAFLSVSMYPVLSTVPGTKVGFQYITNSQFICGINPDFHILGIRFLWSIKQNNIIHSFVQQYKYPPHPKYYIRCWGFRSLYKVPVYSYSIHFRGGDNLKQVNK